MSCIDLVKDEYKYYARRMDEVFDDTFSKKRKEEMLKTMSEEEYDKFKKDYFKLVLNSELKSMAISSREFNGKKADFIATIMNANINREATGSHLEISDILVGVNTQLKKGTKASEAVGARLNAKAIIEVEGNKINVVNHLQGDTGDFTSGIITGARSTDEITRTAQDALGNEIEKALTELNQTTGVRVPKKEAFILSNIMNRSAIESRFKNEITASEKLFGKSKSLTSDKLRDITGKMESDIFDIVSRAVSDVKDSKYITETILDYYGLADGYVSKDTKSSGSIFGRARKLQNLMEDYNLSNETMLDIAKLGNTDGNFALMNTTRKLKEAYKQAYSFGDNNIEFVEELVRDLKNNKAGELRFKTKKDKDRAFNTLEKILDGLRGDSSSKPDTLGVRLIDSVANLASFGKVPLIGTQAVLDPLVNIASSSMTLNKGGSKFSTAIEALTSGFNTQLLDDFRKLPVDDLLAISEAVEHGFLHGLLDGGTLETAYTKPNEGIIKRMSNVSYDSLSGLRQVEDFTKRTAMNLGRVTLGDTLKKFSFQDILDGKSSRAISRIVGNSGLNESGYNLLKEAVQSTGKYSSTKELVENVKKNILNNKDNLLITPNNLDTRALLEYNRKAMSSKTGYTFKTNNGIMPKNNVEKLIDDAIQYYSTRGQKDNELLLKNYKNLIMKDVVISLDKTESIRIDFNGDSNLVATRLDEKIKASLREKYREATEKARDLSPKEMIDSLRANPTESNNLVKEYNDFIRNAKPSEIDSIATNKARTTIMGYENILSELQDFNAPSEITEIQKLSEFKNINGDMDTLQYSMAKISNFFKKTGIATFKNMVNKMAKSKGMADSWKDGGALELMQNGFIQSVLATGAGTLNNYLYAVLNDTLANNPEERRSFDKSRKRTPVRFLLANANEGMFMTLGMYESGLSKALGNVGKAGVHVLSGDLDKAGETAKRASKGFYGNRMTNLIADSLMNAWD